MRTSPILTVVLLTLVAPTALAHDKSRENDPWYLQMGLGMNFANATGAVDFDPGLFSALALGYDMGGGDRFGWSLEIEGIYNYWTVDENDLPLGADDGVSELSWWGNAVGDYHFSDKLAFYLGGGVGWVSRIKYDTFDAGSFSQQDKDAVAWQIKTGFKYHMGGLTDFLIGYRYMVSDDLEVTDTLLSQTFDVENEKHIVELGFRWGI